MVDTVARGFGPAKVSRLPLAFLPSGMIVRPLVDGPKPLTASVYTRRKVVLEGVALTLVDRARARFEKLATPSLHGSRVRLAPAAKR